MAYSFGIQKHIINRVSVKTYSPAKTAVDCFKFRSKVGLDVAIEALCNIQHSFSESINPHYKWI